MLLKTNLSFCSRVDQDSPYVLKDPTLIAVAKKYSRTPAQVAMRHLLQRETVVLAKSFNPERIKENFQVLCVP